MPPDREIVGSEGVACVRRAAAHSAKFQAVTVPTTAANWWLLRVACKLSALKATYKSNRKTLIRQPPSRSAATGAVGLFLVRPLRSPREGFFVLAGSGSSPPCPRLSRVQASQHTGITKLRAPSA